jgi:hypothetical protein
MSVFVAGPSPPAAAAATAAVNEMGNHSECLSEAQERNPAVSAEAAADCKGKCRNQNARYGTVKHFRRSDKIFVILIGPQYPGFAWFRSVACLRFRRNASAPVLCN